MNDDLKACPIKKVYKKYKHMDKLFCDPLIRKDYGDPNPYLITMFDLWDAIKEFNTRKEPK